MVPFVGIGVVTGSISKLARNMYRHKSKIRIISGLILICYAIYLIVFHLIS
jgi:cytochrome c biogenesis protein CcdA